MVNSKYLTDGKPPDSSSSWTEITGFGYFQKMSSQLTWSDAQAYCVGQGGFLAELQSRIEYERVMSMSINIFANNLR